MLADGQPDAGGLILVVLDGFFEDVFIFLHSPKIYRLRDG
jgi:hypothetical protein